MNDIQKLYADKLFCERKGCHHPKMRKEDMVYFRGRYFCSRTCANKWTEKAAPCCHCGKLTDGMYCGTTCRKNDMH